MKPKPKYLLHVSAALPPWGGSTDTNLRRAIKRVREFVSHHGGEGIVAKYPRKMAKWAVGYRRPTHNVLYRTGSR